MHHNHADFDLLTRVSKDLGALVVKNYFLTPRSRNVFVLCSVRPEARLKTSDISKQAGTSRLSFAENEDLRTYLNCAPGAVGAFGLLFDENHAVRYLMDQTLLDEPEIAFHLCDDTVSCAVSMSDFLNKFLPSLGVNPEFVAIHDFITANSSEIVKS